MNASKTKAWLHGATLAVSIGLSACSSAPVAKQTLAPIAPDDRYVPVNFALDAGEYISVHEAAVARHLSETFRNSGRFVRVERNVATWPQTLLMTYRWQPSRSAGEFAGAMASAATLLIVPAPLTEQHTLKVEILQGGIPVKEFSYTEEVKTSLSLFNDPVEDRKLGVERLLNRFYADLAESKVIPRAKDVLRQTKDQPT